MYKQSGVFSRFRFVVADNLKEHFKEHKWLYLCFGLFVVLGLSLGFVSASGRADDIALSDLPDVVLLKFVNKTITPLSFFFSRFFSFLGLFLLIYACGSTRFLSFVSLFVVFYRAVLLAVNCSILVHLYRIGGIIDVILLFFPVHFLLLCAFLVWASVCVRQSFLSKNTGVSVFSGQFLCQHRMCLLFCLSLAFVLFLIESFVLSSFSSIIFVGVS